MEILLLILKILGIILLSLLGLVLFILLLVLFVPFRYKLVADYHSKFHGTFKVTYLLHLVSVSGYFNSKEDMNVILRILGIKFYDMNKAEEKEQTASEETCDEAVTEGSKTTETTETNENIETTQITETGHEPEQEAETEIPKEEETESVEATEEESTFDTSFEGFFRWIRYLIRTTYRKLKNLKCSIEEFCDKIKKAYAEYDFYKRLFESEVFYKAFESSKKQLRRLLKHILPRKISGYIHFGMDDPATTGKILGYSAVLYPYVRNRIVMQPDFETKCFDTNLKAIGKLRVIVLLDILRCVYFNKAIKHVYRVIKRRMNHE